MKTNIFILLSALLFGSGIVRAQTINVGSLECGWNYIYDNAGNRKARVYHGCNQSNKTDSTELDIVTLYPNPTDGTFQVEFNKELKDAEVIVVDNTGRLIVKQVNSGLIVPIDLTGQAAGVYHVTIRHNNRFRSKSVIKTD